MNTAHDDFKLINDGNSGDFSSFFEHKEAFEYAGCEYHYNNQRIIQRTSKITPKKVGQFVTLWKRCLRSGKTMPFEVEDKFDCIIILCLRQKSQGIFQFPKKILLEKGIISNKLKEGGKRGFRVYPSWDCPTSKQAKITQSWQLAYFSNNLVIS